jgi:hypothetical protein
MVACWRAHDNTLAVQDIGRANGVYRHRIELRMLSPPVPDLLLIVMAFFSDYAESSSLGRTGIGIGPRDYGSKSGYPDIFESI